MIKGVISDLFIHSYSYNKSVITNLFSRGFIEHKRRLKNEKKFNIKFVSNV